MKNTEELKKLLLSWPVRDLAEKAVYAILGIYLVLFCLETILPGLVIKIFNFNLLVAVALILSLLGGFFPSAKREEKIDRHGWAVWGERFFFCGILATVGVALYRAPLLESLGYVFLAGLVWVILRKNIV